VIDLDSNSTTDTNKSKAMSSTTTMWLPNEVAISDVITLRFLWLLKLRLLLLRLLLVDWLLPIRICSGYAPPIMQSIKQAIDQQRNATLLQNPAYERVKLAQAHMLTKSIEKFRADHVPYVCYLHGNSVLLVVIVTDARWHCACALHCSTAAVVVCGDFNSQKASRVYQFLTKGKVHGSRFGEAHGLALQSAYSQLGEPETNFTLNFVGCLDYIWYTPELSATHVLAPAGESLKIFENIKGLPNNHLPSDHVCLLAVLVAASA
jgi:hypothetical protein